MAELTIPPKIAAIIELLHTQDNRITSHPLFAVQQKRVIYGLDEDYADTFSWVDEDGEVTDPEVIAQLESGDLSRGARRVGYIEKWEFVTGCLTERGCKDFIACNGHNLNEPRIYAYSAYRNAEFIALREWLMSLRTSIGDTPAPQSTEGGEACETEQDCAGMPWCRINGKCQRAHGVGVGVNPSAGEPS